MRRMAMRWLTMRWMVAGLLVSLLLTFAAAWPVYSQSMSLKQLLAGRDIPSSIQAKELTPDYRVVKVGDNNEQTMWQMRMFGWNAVTMAGGAYYTKGDTVKAGETTYLIAYRVNEDPRELRRRLQTNDSNDNPLEPRKLGPNETLTLSLLNLRTAGSLGDVRPFDAAKDLYTEAEYKAVLINRSNGESNMRMRQVGLAIKQYLSDYDEKFPPMVPATSFRQIPKIAQPNAITLSTPVQVRLIPYLRDAELFRHPVTKELYRFNTSLSYKSESDIERLAETAMIYEGTPAPDGTRGVTFTDGHVQRVREDEWVRIKKRSGMAQGNVMPSTPGPPTKAEKLKQVNQKPERNLRQMGLAILQYVQDYDELLPPMRPATSFRQIEHGFTQAITANTPVQVRIYPYTREREVFRHPVTKDLYRPNQSLSFRNPSSFDRVADIALFYEGNPASDGTRAVVFLDGHVARLKEAAWRRTTRLSGIALRTRTAKLSRSRGAPSGRGSPSRRRQRSRSARY